ncbi:lipopolysaccharide heptosyltransferase II [Chromobacterium piscinae]|uniref:lipopolysaccharide heptosyltransferase II n=1 Tax=Chromobacterium piscinae TaxID=686831 RepID=A0ABV0H2S2_9NEIS|nr:lipopolysaccharide heptosyltransferase II [Chromobacterium piscinae]MBX9349662.1 lipopolysaccharide heptosyltransferase II [Chromobacterium vaccinii]MCD4504046.1 lipopolysaccharide heptosyltransferase II [Chromobacterium piscinae]NHQ83422.1 lipopolysaccharide heptosyltransferase II [Chromobacterium vaccinii]
MKKKILVIGPSWVGDSVMAQPLYRRLHQRHPGLELHVFAPAWTLPLLARMPEVAQSHLNPFGHGALRLVERWKVARHLARERFDQVIVLPNSLKSALIPLFAGIPLRTGFLGESRYGLLNDARELDEQELPMMVERFCALAEDRNQPLPRPIPNPQLIATPSVQRQAAAKLGLDVSRPIAAFCPGAEYGPAKRWPARHFAELAKRFQAAGYAVWLFGSAKDKQIGDDIARLAGDAAVNLCGATGLDEAIDLMGLAKLAVCNDSGLMHVAAALDKPLVALYGSSSPDFTPPLSQRAEIVSLNLDCSPCFERSCPYGHTDCLEKMQPELVWQAAQRLLPSLVPLAQD